MSLRGRRGPRKIHNLRTDKRPRGLSPGSPLRDRKGIAPAACVLAGGLFPLAFSPYGFWPIALASLLVLYATIHGVRSRSKALARCFLFALGKYGIGAYWILVSLNDYADLPSAIAATWFATFLVLASALFSLVALFAVSTRFAIVDALVFASGIFVAEVALSIPWAMSFPWLHTGYALIDTSLSFFAPLGGVWAVGFAAAFTVAALGQAWKGHWVPLLVAAPLWCPGLLFSNGSPNGSGEPFSVAVVQGNVRLEDKWRLGATVSSLDRYLMLSDGLEDADLVVWPESAVPVDVRLMQGRIPEAARELDGRLVFGGFEEALVDGNAAIFNVAAAYENGNLSVFRKERLVPFAEYVPLPRPFGEVQRPRGYPMSALTPSSGTQEPLRIGGRTLAVAICYEVAYPQIVHRRARGSDLIVVLSEDSWLGDTTGPWQHLQIARMRALELGRYLVRATNDGVSAIVDPNGHVVGMLPRYESAVLTGTITSSRGETFFGRFGLLPMITLALLVAGADWIARTLNQDNSTVKARSNLGRRR